MARPRGTWTDKHFRDALIYAAKKGGGQKRLRGIAEKLLQAAESGEAWAIGMTADRLDGKPGQAVQHQGHDGGELVLTWLPPQ